jgi:hypothetical protein
VAFADYTLNILHINDLHSRIESINRFDSTCSSEDETEGKCFGGIARVKTKIDERRDALTGEGANVLVLDAGDQFQGSLFYSTYKGKAAAEFMNGIGFRRHGGGQPRIRRWPRRPARFHRHGRVPGHFRQHYQRRQFGARGPHQTLHHQGNRWARRSRCFRTCCRHSRNLISWPLGSDPR